MFLYLPFVGNLIPAFHNDFNRRTPSAVACPLGHAARRNAQPHIHFGLKNDLISSAGHRRMDSNFPGLIYRGVHEQVDGLDDRPALSHRLIDIVIAIGVPVPVLIEKVIHLRAAAGKQLACFPTSS